MVVGSVSVDAISAGRRKSRLDGLDVLRGMAVGLVLLRHAWPGTFSGAGIVGVVIFFVLSGYLITGVLQRDIGTYGRVRYRRFYAHRAFRLLPALAGFLAVYAIVEISLDALGDRTDGIIGNSVAAALLYVQDLPLPIETSVAVAPLWTLAVEEQFYFVWPALLLFASNRGRVGRLLAVSAVLILLAMASSVVLSSAVMETTVHLYPLPTTWGVALIAGSAIHIYRQSLFAMFASGRVRMSVGLLAIAALTVASLFAEVKESAAFYLIGGPAITIASSVLVVLGASRTVRMPGWTRPLRLLGLISYAAYLWNYLIVAWLGRANGDELSSLASVGSIALTIFAAIISWFTVEALGRRWRAGFDARHVDDTSVRAV